MKKILSLLIVVFFVSVHTTEAQKKKRTAYVQIVNKMGIPMYNVQVIHKYSNNYKERKKWEVVKPNEKTASKLKVNYNTGFGTSGKDWWIVSWTTAVDTNRFYYYVTNPKNFRGIIDKLERGTQVGLPIVVGVGSAAASAYAGPAAGVAAAAGFTIGEKIAQATMNNASTAGFKQHILRSDDNKKTTKIIISQSGVTFKSPSGTSKTKFKKKLKNAKKR